MNSIESEEDGILYNYAADTILCIDCGRQD